MARPADDFDLILVGGGLAACLTAWRLALDRPEVRVAVVEREAQLGGRHTWSFFDSDLDEADRAWLTPAVAHRWSAGHEVYFPGRSRTLSTAYNSLTSEALHEAVAPLLGDRLVLGEADSVDQEGVVLTDGRRLSARGVIDARGPRATAHLDLGWQVFLGRTLRLREPHGLIRPTIMDATVAQTGGYRFVYLLPLDARTVMVEDTCYSDSPKLDRAALGGRIDAYARSRGWTVEAVICEEEGVLPIALDGDIDAFWAEGPPAARAGLMAALFHPVTGYSLPDAVGLAREISAAADLGSASLRALTEARSKRLWRERGFYRLLNRMLFRAADPGQRWRVFQRFYGLPEGVVRRFYAGRCTVLDKVRILAGKPPVPVAAALRQLRESGQGSSA
ncbi:MAG: lycopene beta-cyclase CrtY [Brevundimonas sp.]|uniref:lycopene beta-cyclase CrtY n=1 Tax=Brevundimonas sp. TaxID=1871086 RepID=UPI002487AF5D|nr:lycopene beta-cyclase CrtY [Brevundimonas sp.]MDI1326739.1 lycopene beta-cyclase CrtY [Brevundimonas sp.]